MGQRSRHRTPRETLAGCSGFCGTLAVKLIQAPPYDPETKGVVERANGYLRTSFLPGRSFTSPADFNTQLATWLSIANAREHRITHRRPVDALTADRAAMAPLPPMPPAVGTTITTRLGRDYYVGVGGSSYSVHPDAIGRMITVRSTLDRVQAFCDHRLMADHPRVWGTSALITDPVHVDHAKTLRAQYNSTHRDSAPATPVEVEVADLSAYDTVFARRGGRVMAARTPAPSEADKLIAHHARALKAPRITAEYHRLAEHARSAGWSLEGGLRHRSEVSGMRTTMRWQRAQLVCSRPRRYRREARS